MYGPSLIRIACILLVGLAASYSPPYRGFQWWLDAWLWLGIRDLTENRLVPLALSGAAAIAALAGCWCPSTAVAVRRPARWALVFALVAGVALWLLRVQRWFGDLVGIDKELLPWWTVETAEPLGAYTFYYTMHGAAALGIKGSTALAMVSTAFGASAIAAMFLWANLVSSEWPLLLAMLASSGFMVLFCGYPEKGTPKALGLVCWYVYFGTRELRERRAALQVLSGLFLSSAILMHGSVLCWLPAHAWYVWRRAPRRAALAGVAAFLAPMAAMLYYAQWFGPRAGGTWGNVAAPWQWIKRYCITNCGYDFWSLPHLQDVLSCLLVLSPVATVCLPEALVRSRDDLQRWLALGALGCLFLSATWFPVFGYNRDWDIFALTPLAISFHAALIAARLPPARFRSLGWAWIVGSALHTASWWRYFHLDLP